MNQPQAQVRVHAQTLERLSAACVRLERTRAISSRLKLGAGVDFLPGSSHDPKATGLSAAFVRNKKTSIVLKSTTVFAGPLPACGKVGVQL